MTTLLDEDLLTPADAAKVLQLSGDMVRLLARSGRLPTAARSVRGARMFRRSDVEELAAERAGRLNGKHAVQFYESDAFLAEAVATFLGGGLALGARALIIATPAHREAFCRALEAAGHDVKKLQDNQKLIVLDARQTMSQFMVKGVCDPVRFKHSIGALVQRYAGRGDQARLHAYGEMADLLISDGQSQAALEVEELWNGLGREQPFTLLCGYPMSAFATPGTGDVFARVCALHKHIHPTEKYLRHNSREARLREIAMLQQRAAAADVLAAKLNEREQLLRKLGHELRNPLAPIVSELQLAGLKKDTSRHSAVIARQMRKLLKVVDQLSESDGSEESLAARFDDAPIVRRPSTGYKVLIVDDNVDAVESLSEVLTELGYVARGAIDAGSALKVAKELSPHVALLDIELPGVSGIELARSLKASADTAAIRLVALTGYGRAADRQQTRAAGCEEHLVKPIDVNALERLLNRLLAGGGARA